MTHWDHEFDVVVVGSGNGALTSAVSAHDHAKAKVLIIEKNEKIGGTSAVSGGGIWIPNTHYAKAAGAKDSFDDAKAYLRSTIPADYVSDELIDTYLHKAPEMLKYMADNSRVKYESLAMYPDYYTNNEGAREGHRSLEPTPMKRSELGQTWRHLTESHQMMYVGPVSLTQKQAHKLMTEERFSLFIVVKLMLQHFLDFGWRKEKTKRGRRITMGAAGVGRLLWSTQDRGIPLWRETAMKELIQDESGRVIGIIAEKDGKQINIKANKGVILASGGYEHNDELRNKYLPKPSNHEWSAGCATNTGDALLASQKVGAKLDKMEHAWWITTWNVPGEKLPRISVIEKSLPGTMMVNVQGKRFANESQNYMKFQHELFETHSEESPNDPAWMIFDANYRKENMVGPLMKTKQRPDAALPKRFFTPEFLCIGKTLDELAEKTGINAENLKKTVADFNEYAKTGKDEQFGRGDSAYDRYYGKEQNEPNPCLGPIEKGPFYAVRSYPGDFGTGGGPAINKNAQVLSEANGEPIPGLYACGNCAAAILPTYPGPGSTLGPAMTFGYLAGKHIGES